MEANKTNSTNTANIQALKTRLLEITDLLSAVSVLNWDMSTYMPPGGAPARGRSMGTLSRIAHEKAVDPEIGRLLDALQPYAESLPPDHDDAALVRLTRREYERETRMSSEWVAAITEHQAMLYDLWTRARPANDFAAVEPHLERMLDLSRQYSDFFPGYTHIADPHIERADYGMSAVTVRDLFARLREGLVPLVMAIAANAETDDAVMRQHYPQADQLAFGETIIRDYGYDFERGRQDLTHHPFMTRFSVGDIRITTRVDEQFLTDALFSTLHEAGHALYEQGTNPAFDGLPLGGGTSAGVHESQSRTWENLVGRSRGLWEHYYPSLQAAFPQQLGNVPLDTFHRAINKVKPSLIRVDADEVTYNLHVMIRFDLEMQLLEGTLAIKDLPEAWHARYQSDLGVVAPDDRDGVLQDVHWYAGNIGGMFQGYTLGNLMSAQFYEAALAAHPSIPDEIRQGEFGTLRGWLTENIYQHGAKYTAAELVQRITGGDIQVEPLLRYLQNKYSDLYTLNAA